MGLGQDIDKDLANLQKNIDFLEIKGLDIYDNNFYPEPKEFKALYLEHSEYKPKINFPFTQAIPVNNFSKLFEDKSWSGFSILISHFNDLAEISDKTDLTYYFVNVVCISGKGEQDILPLEVTKYIPEENTNQLTMVLLFLQGLIAK